MKRLTSRIKSTKKVAKVPGRYRNNWITYLIDGLVVAVVLGSLAFAIFGGNRQAEEYACERPGVDHRVQLSGDAFSKRLVVVNRCDTLTIENRDTLSYNLNFGDYESHFQYPGYQAMTLLPNESLTIDAFEAGEYELHDHFRDNAQLTLDVRDTQ